MSKFSLGGVVSKARERVSRTACSVSALAASMVMSSSASAAWDPATENFWDAWIVDAQAGFDEHKIAIAGVGGFLLIAIIFKNSFMSVFSMLGSLGRGR